MINTFFSRVSTLDLQSRIRSISVCNAPLHCCWLLPAGLYQKPPSSSAGSCKLSLRKFQVQPQLCAGLISGCSVPMYALLPAPVSRCTLISILRKYMLSVSPLASVAGGGTILIVTMLPVSSSSLLMVVAVNVVGLISCLSSG